MKFINAIVQGTESIMNYGFKLFSTSDQASMTRVLALSLVASGITLGFMNGNPENVRTFIFSGAGLLVGGKFAEGIQNRIGGN